eukprot:TRINITY_DN20009_c0_g1_i1.p1 TRINITY_DN20009_c0_g1~~TRINITY_DN20009_c0_g1_i1.p1  ORF type:complete len:285 (-),score=73.85 TRINITY_DN20009_c0_g1_i1:33-815(-)
MVVGFRFPEDSSLLARSSNAGRGAVYARTSFESQAEENALKSQMDSLRTQMEQMNEAWSKGRQAMEMSYGKTHSLKQQMDSIWKDSHDKLEAACLKLRDSLDKAGEDRVLCEEAQGSDAEGLPALFLKRFEEPDRFAKFQGGEIRGCGEGKCSCPSGHEELGCQDATDRKRFELKCTDIMNRQVKDLDVLSYFRQGGACVINRKDEIVRPLVADEILKKMKASCVDAELISLAAASQAHDWRHWSKFNTETKAASWSRFI